ncbi:hypothetical protein MYRA21_3261 [Myroides sp. A21]|nr:hypothetical protein MYRA21_3261 [Myroides sp. A21]
MIGLLLPILLFMTKNGDTYNIMIGHQETISFSKYSELYDMLVPKNNTLRKINDLVDFSFIYEELSSKYSSTKGRMAYSPIRLFYISLAPK